jgi:hypothetical protein
VARDDELEMLGVVNSVEYGEDSTSWVSKDVLYAVAEHHFMENLTTRKPNKRVVHGGGGALELRNITVGLRYLLKSR